MELYIAFLIYLLPLILWVVLRKYKNWSHVLLANLAPVVYISLALVFSYILQWSAESSTPGCNDCIQGQGLALAFILTPGMMLYTGVALTFNIYWLVRTIRQKAHKQSCA